MRRPVARSTRSSHSHGANADTTCGPSSPSTTAHLSCRAYPSDARPSRPSTHRPAQRRPVRHWPCAPDRRRRRRPRYCRPVAPSAPERAAEHRRRQAGEDRHRSACPSLPSACDGGELAALLVGRVSEGRLHHVAYQGLSRRLLCRLEPIQNPCPKPTSQNLRRQRGHAPTRQPRRCRVRTLRTYEFV
jgi:hypothetical protein